MEASMPENCEHQPQGQPEVNLWLGASNGTVNLGFLSQSGPKFRGIEVTVNSYYSKLLLRYTGSL
jgi:hypothetical protein